MDIRELRIGNWVLNTQENKIQKVNIYILDRIVKRSTDYSPIPITAERLINAGFSKDFGKDIYNKEDITWCFWNPSSIIININNGFVNYNLEIECGYIHQLQNIVFDLTKKEIEFKTENHP